jgi:hypothetical protein
MALICIVFLMLRLRKSAFEISGAEVSLSRLRRRGESNVDIVGRQFPKSSVARPIGSKITEDYELAFSEHNNRLWLVFHSQRRIVANKARADFPESRGEDQSILPLNSVAMDRITIRLIRGIASGAPILIDCITCEDVSADVGLFKSDQRKISP